MSICGKQCDLKHDVGAPASVACYDLDCFPAVFVVVGVDISVFADVSTFLP